MVDGLIQPGESFRRRHIPGTVRAGIYEGERNLVETIQVLFVDVFHSGSQKGV